MGQLVNGLGGVRQVMGMRCWQLAGEGQSSPSGGSSPNCESLCRPWLVVQGAVRGWGET